jgi:hypothetical protein
MPLYSVSPCSTSSPNIQTAPRPGLRFVSLLFSTIVSDHSQHSPISTISDVPMSPSLPPEKEGISHKEAVQPPMAEVNETKPRNADNVDFSRVAFPTVAKLSPPIGQFVINTVLQVAALGAAIAFGVYAVKSVTAAIDSNNYAARAVEQAVTANQLAILTVYLSSMNQVGSRVNINFVPAMTLTKILLLRAAMLALYAQESLRSPPHFYPAQFQASSHTFRPPQLQHPPCSLHHPETSADGPPLHPHVRTRPRHNPILLPQRVVVVVSSGLWWVPLWDCPSS